ncbi:N-acetyltransferase [Spongiibacter sp. KMU-158]|uniref:N-acetyltransferase n=1 Tax=Spongiibacter pelagi TaxID=2760804 RepID=A0A927C0J0_9GAMM|nr:GNAT family N-acetyltransferase [Spongiibacter pelagi]MBD2857637.1 N-acetyltransferase [Spongiibacter pelagi]
MPAVDDALELHFHSTLSEIERSDWDGLLSESDHADYPFLKYDFLSALESASAVSAQTGWQPYHLEVRQTGRCVALMPLYLKSHSYGEYVFDWAWADAYQRHGLDYYPKLLAAIPFTPATGPRLLLANSSNKAAIEAVVVEQLRARCAALNASSLHLLFPEKDVSERWRELGTLQRIAAQYHWFNRDYQSFDDFLARFSSRKRKNLRKERLRVAEQGLRLERIEGGAVTPEQWQFFFHCYQMTYAKRSGHGGYLNEAFFQALAKSMPESLLLVLCFHGDTPVAAALNLKDSKTLYGRYWGCVREYEYLHFEACYYQGIEYCIEQGLQRFDPGAQGEHKIQRGFEPILTYSNHWLAHEGFSDAVARFLAQEWPHIKEYLNDAAQLLPFKAESD